MLNKCCDIAGLGDHQSAILTDIECHPKKQNQYLQKSISGKIANLKLLHETIQQNPKSSIATNDVRTPVNTLSNTCQHGKSYVSLSITLKTNVVPGKFHLLDTANHGLPVVVKRKKKQKAKKANLA